MFTSRPRSHKARAQQTLTLLLTTCLTLLAITVGAAARTAQPTATTSSTALHNAIAVRNADRHTLTRDSAKLSLCVRVNPNRCSTSRRAAKHARVNLAAAERRLRSLSAHTSRRRHGSSNTPTPVTTSTQTLKLTVSGQTLNWSAVNGVNSFVFVRKVPGQPDQYSEISGTSVTPPAVPGTTVSFSIRTNVSGSSWAPEVSIAYPASTPVTPPSETTSSGTGSGSGSTEGTSGSGGLIEGAGPNGPFEMGVVVGSAVSWEMTFVHKLGAHTAREEFEIGTTPSQMSSTIETSAKAGVKPLLLASFYGTLPTPTQAQSLGTWAAQFGPGGSFWKGKSFPASDAVTSIEFGNETSYEYQYSDDSASGYATRAQTYALRFKEAQAAIHAANPNVALLAQGDPGNAPGTSWMDNMFKAVPNLGSIVGGWTVHPYGPGWQSIMDKVVSSAKADGAPSGIPLDVTEWGLSTDNGRCLDDNYGFNKCMTYQEAATTLTSNLSAMRARYGSRLASLYLFQARDQKETGTSGGREGYFGALQSNEATKGAYTTTVQSLLSTNA